jgi:hypothetical protein
MDRLGFPYKQLSVLPEEKGKNLSILRSVRRSGLRPGRHFLFVNNFNYSALESYVRDFCYSCEGASWHAVAEKVGRLGKWEFEDYVPRLK